MDVIVALIILLIAFFTGKIAEFLHYRSIKAREKKLGGIPAVTFKTLPDGKRVEKTALASGSVVVSVDHFKKFLMVFRQIFGGEVHSYSPLIDRGRREAILRMKEKAPTADMFLNLRIETSTISSGKGKTVGCVEIVAYSTAIKFQT